jgi:histidyl-tRNA synthetase
VDLYIALQVRETSSATAAFVLAREARRAGLAAQLELAGRSLKGQLKQADRVGARYVAIVEEDAQGAALRDMGSGEQQEVLLSSVIPAVLRGSRLA